MVELQLVDDLDTARQLVRRGLARGYGPGRLRQMLYEKQIPKTLWDQVLEDLPEPDEAIAAFLDRRPAVLQWLVVMAGLLCLLYFGIFREGYIASQFIYQQY